MNRSQRLLLLMAWSAALASLGGLALWLPSPQSQKLPSTLELDEAAPAAARVTLLRRPEPRQLGLVQPTTEREVVADNQQLAEDPITVDAAILRGSVLARDLLGRQYSGESGSLRIRFATANGWRFREVAVKHGKFACEPFEFDHLQVDRLVVAGRCAQVVYQELDQGELFVEAQLAESTILEVFCKASGRPLDQLAVILGRASKSAPTHPGNRTPPPQVQAAISPVDLGPYLDSERPATVAWVSAPGFSWGKVNLNPWQGGRHRLELSREASFRVDLSGPVPSDPTFLRVWRSSKGEERQLIGQRRVWEGGSIQIDGLPREELQATLEMGPVATPLEVLAEETLFLADQNLQVSSWYWSFAEPTPSAILQGTLVLAEESAAPRLLIMPQRPYLSGPKDWTVVEADQLQQRGPGLFHWTDPQRLPGTYQIAVEGAAEPLMWEAR